MLGYGGDRELFAICTCRFRLKFLILFPLVTAKLIGDNFDIELYGARGFFFVRAASLFTQRRFCAQ
jgi:hypothetical protein